MDSSRITFILNQLKSVLNSNLISIAEVASKYTDLEIFDFDLKTPIKNFPKNGHVDKISLNLLPIDFRHLFPAKITGNGNCLMNLLSFIFTSTKDTNNYSNFLIQ